MEQRPEFGDFYMLIRGSLRNSHCVTEPAKFAAFQFLAVFISHLWLQYPVDPSTAALGYFNTIKNVGTSPFA